jgi:hypothetical protein
MRFLQRLWRPSSLSSDESARAARLGAYFVEASGFDRQERSMFIQTVAVCLNAAEAWATKQAEPTQPGWEDVEYKIWGPRPLLGLLQSHALGVREARVLLSRAANGEPHDILPEPLTPEEQTLADGIQVYLIWYEDKFHYGNDRDSFAILVCLSREEAEAEYASQHRQPAESGGDGYEIVGPSALVRQPAEVVREVLRRINAGEPGPVPIPSIYY